MTKADISAAIRSANLTHDGNASYVVRVHPKVYQECKAAGALHEDGTIDADKIPKELIDRWQKDIFARIEVERNG